MLCAKFGWNWPSGSGEEDENVKSLQRTTEKFYDNNNDKDDVDNDDGQRLRWAK